MKGTQRWVLFYSAILRKERSARLLCQQPNYILKKYSYEINNFHFISIVNSVHLKNNYSNEIFSISFISHFVTPHSAGC